MTNVASLASVAALIGEPARTAMLVTLMDGRALTAGELAGAAGITPPTASGHLGQMLEAGLIALERQGRHHYYRLAGRSVATLLESMMSLTGELALANRPRPVVTGPRDRALRRARVCYDHLAGELAVAIADALVARGYLDFAQDGGALTLSGSAFLGSIGIMVPQAGRTSQNAYYCRPCLDWSERKLHIAGAIGREMYARFIAQGWLLKPCAGRAVAITPTGVAQLERHFALRLR